MRTGALLFLLHALMGAGDCAAQDLDAARRERMLYEIRSMALETGRHRFDDRVMEAMGKVPRHRFVPASQQAHAYENRPLPIGEGQTISQPYIVALMTDLLNPKSSDSVLEVGTGSGYQAAVLALLVSKVYTIEIVAPLGTRATETLKGLGYSNVVTRIGDGYNGWPEAAPFDSILVTAAADEIPKPLIEQLKPGGRLVIPVGGRSEIQQLMTIDKNVDGTTLSRRTVPVRFVPLIRGK
jgi:protein-L-isoaspartate(D-aspartate) O-methyltransferase